MASGLDAARLGLREELTVGENIPVSQEVGQVACGGAIVGSAPQAQHPPGELQAVDLGSQQAAARPAQVRWCCKRATSWLQCCQEDEL